MNKRIDTDLVNLFYEHNIDLEGRTIYIGSTFNFTDGTEGGVDWTLSENVIKGLHLLSKEDKPINIILNNPGGYVIEMLAIYDMIKSFKSHVTIVGRGKIFSAAGYIMQAADTRLMSESSLFMLHEGVTGYPEDHPRIVDNWIKADKKLDEMLFDLYLTKIRQKHPKFAKKQLTEMLKFDTILSAKEAKELNLIDGVV